MLRELNSEDLAVVVREHNFSVIRAERLKARQQLLALALAFVLAGIVLVVL